MSDVAGLFGLIGWSGVALMLLVMAALSRRLGRVTQAAPYHRGFYVAALLVLAGVVLRVIHRINRVAAVRDLDQNGTIWVLLTNGLPALGLTIGLVIAWRYWSWLLAERD